jgi:sugar/nucleoside kinase (ribokinase family)
MGMNCAFLGKLGDDKNGRDYKALFHSIGGDCSLFITDGNLPTACCVSLVTPDSERTLRTCLGAAQNLMHSEINSIDFENYRHVHAEGYLIFNRHLIESVLRNAKSVGCSVSLDVGSFEVIEASHDFLPCILSDYVDIVFANKEEAITFSGTMDLQESLEELGQHCKVVAIKLGKDGAILKNADETVKIPAATTDRLCDTTGAGDYWAAGFLYGYLNGYPIVKSGRVASLFSRKVIEHRGTMLPQKIWDSIIFDTATILKRVE